MNRILEIDLENRCAVVEPGVYNLDQQTALAPHKFYFAPDPASQRVATIGGHVAENAGGPHWIKYGVTVNHILGLEIVTPDGEILMLGGKAEQQEGYDLMSLIIGSEGTLGMAICIRLFCLMIEIQRTRKVKQAGDEILAGGIQPGGTISGEHGIGLEKKA